MKRKNIIIGLLFLLGLAIAAYPHIAKIVNDHQQKETVKEFRDMEMTSVELESIKEDADQCNREILANAEGFRDPFGEDQSIKEEYKKCFDLSGGDVFAAIEIPKLDLLTPVYLGATDEILMKGVGQVEGSSLPVGGTGTHTVLAGHRGMPTKAMFRDLDQIGPGDRFYIHTLNETLVYEVYDQQIIYPDQTESLEISEGKDLATLITCHPYRHNYQRLLIHGERVDT